MFHRLLIAMSVAWAGCASAESVVIKVPGSPIELSELETAFAAAGEQSSFTFTATVENVSNSDVAAFSVGYVALDAVGDVVGGTGRYLNLQNTPPGQRRQIDWSTGGHEVRNLRNMGSGVAFVRRARLDDGTIWRADDAALSEALAPYVD